MSNFLRRVVIGLFYLLFLCVPLFFTVKNEELFEFNKMILTYVIVVLMATAWGVRLILERSFNWKKTFLDLPFLIFILSQIISTVLSLHPRTSLFGYYTRFHGGLLSTLAYTFLFYAFIHHVSKKHISWLLCSLLFGGLLASLYAFPEHFGFSPSCLILDKQFNATCWVQDVQTRVFGTFGQPNWLAAYIIMLWPIGYVFFFQWTFDTSSLFTHPSVRRTVGVLYLALLFCVLLFTQSRSGFLGWSLSAVILGLFVLFKVLRKQKNIRQEVTANIAPVLVVLSCLLLFGSPFTPNFSQLLSKFQTIENTSNAPETSESSAANRLDIGGTDSGEIRKIVWTGAVNVWKRYPMFGSGVETFAYSYYKDRPIGHNTVSEWDFLYNKAHNEFLNILATTGAVGLTAYLLLQGAILAFCAKNSFLSLNVSHSFLSKIKTIFLHKDSENAHNQSWLGVATFAGIVALHVSNFFGFSTVMVSILLFVFPAFVLALSQEDSIEEVKKLEMTTIRKITAFLFICIMMFLLLKVFMIWIADFYLARSKGMLRDQEYATALTSAKYAVQFSPNDGVMYESYARVAAQYALVLASNQEWQASSDLANSSLEAIDTALKLNPVHLNFYKSRNQILVSLSQIEPTLLEEAKKTIIAAIELAPTDPKLVFNLGVLQVSTAQKDEAVENFKKAIEMKPNYDSARAQLAALYEEQKEYEKAIEQYTYILEYIAPNNEELKSKIQLLEASAEARKKN